MVDLDYIVDGKFFWGWLKKDKAIFQMRPTQISNQINNAQISLCKKNDSKCFLFKGQIPEGDLVLAMKLCSILQESLCEILKR